MITSYFRSAADRVQASGQFTVLGWFCLVFVGWACITSAVRGEVFGVALALVLMLAAFRYFGPLLRRDGGSS